MGPFFIALVSLPECNYHYKPQGASDENISLASTKGPKHPKAHGAHTTVNELQ